MRGVLNPLEPLQFDQINGPTEARRIDHAQMHAKGTEKA